MRKGSRRCWLTVRVTDHEFSCFRKMSKKARISVSELVRNVMLGYNLSEKSNVIATADMLKVNADLARLGNLFKLAVDEGVTDEDRISTLVSDITESQQILRKKALGIKL